MSEEEIKKAADAEGLTVSEYKAKYGIKDDDENGFNDEPQGTPSVSDNGKVSVAVNPPAEQIQEETTAVDPVQQKIDAATSGIKNAKLKEAAGIQAKTAGDVYKTQMGALDELNKNDEEYIKNSRQRFDNYQAKYDAETEATDKLNKQLREDIIAADKIVEDSNKTILNRYIKEAELARKENEIMGKAERNAVKWTGVAELGAALANLIGVARGAQNMNIHSYSSDWMKTADQNRKDRIKRLDSLKDRMDAISAEQAKLKAASAKEMANMNYKIATYKPGRETELAGKQLEHGDRVAALQHGSKSRTIQGKAQADIGLTQGLGTAQLTGTGLTSVGRRGSGTRTTSTKTSSGKTGNYQEMTKRGYYPFLIDGEEYWMDDKTLFRNIQTLKNKISIVNQADREEFETLKTKPQDDQVKFLLSVMDTNPEMKAALIKLSPGKVNDDSSVPEEKKEDSATSRLSDL